MFDKTGTLTHGSPMVVKTALFVKPAQCSMEMLLAVTGTAENHSEHPIGLAITNYAKKVGGLLLTAKNFHTARTHFYSAWSLVPFKIGLISFNILKDSWNV